MRIILVRHGDPDYEHDSLTAQGVKEAEALAVRVGKWTDVKEFYVSPLGRAKQTAEIAMKALDKKAKTLDWLCEFKGRCKHNDNAGEMSHCWDFKPSYWTRKSKFYDKDKWRDLPDIRQSNVESEYDYVADSLDSFLAEHGYVRNGSTYKVIRENEDTIVLFCHFAVSCVMISHLLGISPFALWQGFMAPPTSVTEIISEEREEGTAWFRVSRYGDCSHLYEQKVAISPAGRYAEVYSDAKAKH